MQIEIRTATEEGQIRTIHQALKRPMRERYSPGEFLIAWTEDQAVGCAATAVLENVGYLYGLAVTREWQRKGIGGQLMEARLDALRSLRADYAIALAMFWNSRFFRRHGFAPVKRDALPRAAMRHADLTNPALRRSAVMLQCLKGSSDCR
jgi:N-acetylglutamate synthase-like GNAT family acetyltransferase